MAWYDNLQPASFRGIPFKLDNVEVGIGRRQQTHEYIDAPDGSGKAKAYAEDLGPATQTFQVRGYVVGPDYMTARDALIKALNERGPGQLVHPFRGVIDVQAGECSYSEDNRQGGFASFTMSFTEAGRKQYPTVSIDKLFGVDNAALGVAGATIKNFTDTFKTLQLPEFVRDIASADVGKFSTMLLGFDFPGASLDLVSGFIRDANYLQVNAYRLIRDPADLANRITGLIQQIRGIMGSGTGEKSTTFDPLTKYTSTAPANTSTPSQAQAVTNGDAITDLIRDTAIAEQSSSAVRGVYESYDEAVEVRDDTLAQIDAQAETATDDVYVAFQELRAQVVNALPVEEENLPRLATVRLAETQPAIVLAYDLYDDTSRDTEIVGRNHIPHPGFLPSNRDLQVLSNG